MGRRIRLTASNALFRMRFVGLLCAMSVAALLSGCGGSNSSMGSNGGFTQDASTTFALEISGIASEGLISASAAALSGAAQPRPQQITCSQPSCPVNLPISVTLTCPSGGTMQITGSVDGTVNGSGTGELNIQASIAINNWSCVSGFVINSSPQITVTGTLSFVNGSLANSQTVMIGGGFTWGPNQSNACAANLTINFNSSNGSGNITGTLCGNQIDIPLPTPQGLRD